MEDIHVPVATPVPVGRLEWAHVGETLYGVDQVGQVFIFKAALPAGDELAGISRLVANILGISTGAARPRYRRERRG